MPAMDTLPNSAQVDLVFLVSKIFGGSAKMAAIFTEIVLLDLETVDSASENKARTTM